MPKPEYYISIDCEMDGPCAGLNSMLQLGAAIYDNQGEFQDGYCWNLIELPDTKPDPDTMKWWGEQEVISPGIWQRMRENALDPMVAMRSFHDTVLYWNKQLKARPVAVAYPAGFDFSAVYYYLRRFTGDSCLGLSCIDLKTLSMAILNRNYRDHGKKDMPKHWFAAGLPHTHNALDDAREQGELFFAMLKDMMNLHKPLPNRARPVPDMKGTAPLVVLQPGTNTTLPAPDYPEGPKILC